MSTLILFLRRAKIEKPAADVTIENQRMAGRKSFGPPPRSYSRAVTATSTTATHGTQVVRSRARCRRYCTAPARETRGTAAILTRS